MQFTVGDSHPNVDVVVVVKLIDVIVQVLETGADLIEL